MNKIDEKLEEMIEKEIEEMEEEEISEEEEFEFEEEYFKEEKPKNTLMNALIIGIVLLLSVIVILVLLLFKKNNTTTNVQNNIIDYSEETTTDVNDDSAIETTEEVFDRNDETEYEEVTIEDEEEVLVEEVVPTKAPVPDVMEEGKKDYSKVKYNSKQNLSEMDAYFADNNEAAISDLAHLDRFIAMSYSFKGTTDYAYYGDVNSEGKPDGTGVAVYADNQYYYGSWVNGVRSGAGKWIHFHIHTDDKNKDYILFHQYQGQFANDLPEGDGQEHYEYIIEKLTPGERYITNYICGYKAGKIDGDVYCTTINNQNEYLDWIGTAKEGKFDWISESRDDKKRGPVMYDRENPDGCYWMSAYDNQDLGVISYISAYKK